MRIRIRIDGRDCRAHSNLMTQSNRTEYHHRAGRGVSGNRAGDIIVNDDTGERSLAVSDGHGVSLEPTTLVGDVVSYAQPALPVASCGCTRAQAYRHTPADGFTCRHGNAV